MGWHRCHRWEQKRIQCPFTVSEGEKHEDEKALSPEEPHKKGKAEAAETVKVAVPAQLKKPLKRFHIPPPPLEIPMEMVRVPLYAGGLPPWPPEQIARVLEEALAGEESMAGGKGGTVGMPVFPAGTPRGGSLRGARGGRLGDSAAVPAFRRAPATKIETMVMQLAERISDEVVLPQAEEFARQMPARVRMPAHMQAMADAEELMSMKLESQMFPSPVALPTKLSPDSTLARRSVEQTEEVSQRIKKLAAKYGGSLTAEQLGQEVPHELDPAISWEFLMGMFEMVGPGKVVKGAQKAAKVFKKSSTAPLKTKAPSKNGHNGNGWMTDVAERMRELTAS